LRVAQIVKKPTVFWSLFSKGNHTLPGERQYFLSQKEKITASKHPTMKKATQQNGTKIFAIEFEPFFGFLRHIHLIALMMK
jgi:hypothetical protein